MPLHDLKCRLCGQVEERYIALGDLNDEQRHHCSGDMERVFLKFPMAWVQPDVSYTSPVDGRPITNYYEHLEELARTDSVVYDPGIKQDQEKNERRREEALERSIEQTIEKEIATMPAVKRDRLAAELQGGLTAVPTRVTPPQTTFREQQQ